MVGPLNVRDTIKPLPRDLEEFVSNSGGHGFIIVSFGSQVASLPSREKVDMLATAFGKLKQLVVWRLKGILCFVRSLWLHKGHLRQQLMSYILILHVFYLQRAPMDVPLFFKNSLWPLLFSNIQQILWKRKKINVGGWKKSIILPFLCLSYCQAKNGVFSWSKVHLKESREVHDALPVQNPKSGRETCT